MGLQCTSLFICNVFAGLPHVLLWGTKYDLPVVTQLNIRYLPLSRLAAIQAHLLSFSLLSFPLQLLGNNNLNSEDYQETRPISSCPAGECVSNSLASTWSRTPPTLFVSHCPGAFVSLCVWSWASGAHCCQWHLWFLSRPRWLWQVWEWMSLPPLSTVRPRELRDKLAWVPVVELQSCSIAPSSRQVRPQEHRFMISLQTHSPRAWNYSVFWSQDWVVSRPLSLLWFHFRIFLFLPHNFQLELEGQRLGTLFIFQIRKSRGFTDPSIPSSLWILHINSKYFTLLPPPPRKNLK